MSSKVAVQFHPSQPSQYISGSWSLFTAVLPSPCTPFSDRDAELNQCLALCRVVSRKEGSGCGAKVWLMWSGRIQTGCRFSVLPACGLKQSLSSSSWDQCLASKLQQGLYDSAAKQGDAFLTEEYPNCTHIRCEVIQGWILGGTLSILHSSWKQSTRGGLSFMLRRCSLGTVWGWTRHQGPGSLSEFKIQNHLKSGWTLLFSLERKRFFSLFPPVTLLRSVLYSYLSHFTKYYLKGHVGSMSTTCINIHLTTNIHG